MYDQINIYFKTIKIFFSVLSHLKHFNLTASNLIFPKSIDFLFASKNYFMAKKYFMLSVKYLNSVTVSLEAYGYYEALLTQTVGKFIRFLVFFFLEYNIIQSLIKA